MPPLGYGTAPPGYPTAPPSYSTAGIQTTATVPANTNFGEMTPETARADGQEGPRLPVRSSRFQTLVLASVSAIALAVGAIAVWYRLAHKDTLSSESATVLKDQNFEIEAPGSPWVVDDQMRNELGSPYIFVYRRDNPEAYMAIGAKDYNTRSPRESELENGLARALDILMDKETLSKSEPLESTWMGQEIKGFKFHAQRKKDSTAVDGEAYRFSHKGIGYWFLAWTGENNVFEDMRPEFSETRRHCKLLNLRNDWRERQSAIVPFKGERINYTILDGEGVWEEERDESNVKFEGAEADKKLKLKPDKNKKDAIDDAFLIVYVLPAGGDPLKVARDFVTQKRIKEVKRGGDYNIEFAEVTGPPEGDAVLNPVDNPLTVLRLMSKVKEAKRSNRFHVISAANIDDKIVVVHAYCSAINKATLENLFIQIASSLHGG